MKSYLCANRHHFSAPTALCPSPGCDAEVRPTAMNPLHGSSPVFERLPRLPEEDTPPPYAGKHSLRWWSVARDGTRVRRTSNMFAALHVWDATCACGWDSGTGGQSMASVEKLAQAHKA